MNDSSNDRRRKKKTTTPATKEKQSNDNEVDQLLQAAQDELLLKLSVDSHMSRVSPDYLLPDLDRRFQALKYRPSISKSPNHNNQSSSSSTSSTTVPKSQSQSKSQSQPQPQQEEDDLFARFVALKTSSNTDATAIVSLSGFNQGVVGSGGGGDDDEEDEVEKIIRWAKDAARLDPSPPSDDDDVDRDDDDDDEADCDEVDTRKIGRKK